MARASLDTIKAHLMRARGDAAYAAKLRAELNRILDEKLENNGANIISGSGNGLSFATSQSNPEYEADLYIILRHLEDGTIPASRTLARVI